MAIKLTEAKILRINLSNRKIKEEFLSEDLVKKFFGGRGLASKLLFDEIDPKVDPLSPENKLIFANGLLTGSSAPTAGRYMVVTRGPLTGTIACSNSGGFFGAELRKAGYMLVVIEGKSNKPVFISIIRGKADIQDASHLWGLMTSETQDRLLEQVREPDARVACIGPAGERLVRFAAVINEKTRAAGRTGVGAVMGSKNLKALVVKGEHKIDFHDRTGFSQTVKTKIEALRKDAITGEGLPKLGTKVLDSIINQNGLYPTKNFQFGTFDDTDEISGEALVSKGYLKKNVACFACPIACGRSVELPNGQKGEGPEYETGWAFGADCGVSDLVAISLANNLCNELGIDTISAGATIACAMELYEKGYVEKEELNDGPALKFGSSESIVYYTKAMGYREGFGNKLAEGSYRLADSYGHPELSMSVKRQELPAYDPRGAQGHGLEYATSNRGGCHVRGYMISPEILGVPEKLESQQLQGKAQWVMTFQDLTAVIDSLGLCLFTSFALDISDYRDLINAATGFDLSQEQIMRTGERIWNLEREFNMRAGIHQNEDTLPERLLKEPLSDGPQKGAVAKLDALLPEYYRIRGWGEGGTASQEKKQQLGL